MDARRDFALAGPPGAMRRARPGPLRGQAGMTIVEVLVAALVVGITITGVSLMYGRGTSWMAAIGDDRVALHLAQERIESVRAAGWIADLERRAYPEVETEVRPAWIAPTRPDKAEARAFRRQTCVQYVAASPASPAELGAPPYDPACPAGTPSDTQRITVEVVPVGGDGAPGSPDAPQSSPVTLQGWITRSGL
jgi:type II secretory pathway pseudopilin PulG